MFRALLLLALAATPALAASAEVDAVQYFYGMPPCKADEVAMQPQGVEGIFCSPRFSATAWPNCDIPGCPCS